MLILNRVKDIDNYIAVNTVLISVSDKRNLEILVHGLIEVNPKVTIYSTGGTYTRIFKILGNDGEGTLQSVASYTGQPEMQGGLVKTLDF